MLFRSTKARPPAVRALRSSSTSPLPGIGPQGDRRTSPPQAGRQPGHPQVRLHAVHTQSESDRECLCQGHCFDFCAGEEARSKHVQAAPHLSLRAFPFQPPLTAAALQPAQRRSERANSIGEFFLFFPLPDSLLRSASRAASCSRCLRVPSERESRPSGRTAKAGSPTTTWPS